MPEPQPQRTCSCGGECPKCQAGQPGQEHERLQPKRVQLSDPEETLVVPIINEVLRSPGKPLNPTTRALMEARFGYDFSGVRMHTDAKAAESAQAVRAHAYTVGRDVVFAEGRYDPSGEQGRKLLVHELAHVVQQTGGSNNILETVTKSRQEGLIEKEADATSNKAEKADVEMLYRTSTPSIQLQRGGSGGQPRCRIPHAEAKSCTSGNTGVADPGSVIAEARRLAVSCVSKAISKLRALRSQTILQVDRHFHCPSSSQIINIIKTFEQIQNYLPSVWVLCYNGPLCRECYVNYVSCPTGADVTLCSGSQAGMYVCPDFFLNYWHLSRIRMFIEAAAWQTNKAAPGCQEGEACYDDFTKPTSEMVNNAAPYANFAVEASGLFPIDSYEVAVPCRPMETGFNVVVPPDARTNPRAVRLLTGFEPIPRGSQIVSVFKDIAGKYFIYYSGLPGGRVYMPGEGERFYLPEGFM
ncbi:DUF4157 domain-containing protein [Candidatus Kuenenia sp.]|uniref:eCIS core domain-containing protein n=1 Tax=Candidatus Kuenenia sp. TaxID=2499824 RepID=UPI00322013BE